MATKKKIVQATTKKKGKTIKNVVPAQIMKHASQKKSKAIFEKETIEAAKNCAYDVVYRTHNIKDIKHRINDYSITISTANYPLFRDTLLNQITVFKANEFYMGKQDRDGIFFIAAMPGEVIYVNRSASAYDVLIITSDGVSSITGIKNEVNKIANTSKFTELESRLMELKLKYQRKNVGVYFLFEIKRNETVPGLASMVTENMQVNKGDVLASLYCKSSA